MKKLNNKGFTIVELVIVVAVIAILAAVLIPTISGLVKTAQTSADVTLVKNVNLVLATERALEGKNTTMQEALDDALEGGYDVTKLTPTNSDNHILWDQESDNFVLFANGKYNNAGAEVNVTDEYKLWNIYTEMPETQTYSIYWNGGDIEEANVSVGFDAGENYVATVNYATTAAQNTIIRTNYGALTVDAPNATVAHYGDANLVEINAVASHSYVEHGDVELAKISSGRLVVAQGAELSNVHVVEDGAAIAVVGSATLPNITREAAVTYVEVQSLTSEDATDSTPEYIVADGEGNKICSDKEGNNVVTGSALAESVKNQFVTMEIKDVATAEELKAAINTEGSKVTINVTADIDLGTEYLLVTKSATIYGNGHTITTNCKLTSLPVSDGTVIEIAASDITVEIYNWNMFNTNTDGVARGVNFRNNVNNSNLILDGCSVSAKSYTIRAGATENISITIRNGSVSTGYGSLVLYSNNSTVIIENSVLKGLNEADNQPLNGYGTIVLDGNGFYGSPAGTYASHNNISIIDSEIYADSTEGSNQYWLSIQYGATGNTVKVDSNTKLSNSHGVDFSDYYYNGTDLSATETYENTSTITIGK